MAGILTPDSGACEILGRVPWRRRGEHVRDIGVAFGQRTQLWWDLPVMESFDLLRDIYRVPRADYARSRDELVEATRLEPLLDTLVRQLSLGQRMRCDLAAALLHSPKILFLDEPTIGLDAVSKLAFRDFMRRFNRERGVTVILTTHDIADVEALRERAMVISGGRILSDGPLVALRRRVSGERSLAARLRDGAAAGDFSVEGAEVVRRDGDRVHLRFDPAEVSAAELIRRVTSTYPTGDLFVEDPPIEEIIARLCGAEGAAANRVRRRLHGNGRAAILGVRARLCRGDGRRDTAKRRAHDAVQHNDAVDNIRRRHGGDGARARNGAFGDARPDSAVSRMGADGLERAAVRGASESGFTGFRFRPTCPIRHNRKSS